MVEIWRLNEIQVRAQEDKESWRESLNCLREYIHHQEQNVCRNVNIKGHSGRMRNILLETGGKVILVIKWQKTCLNCVSVVICVR